MRPAGGCGRSPAAETLKISAIVSNTSSTLDAIHHDSTQRPVAAVAAQSAPPPPPAPPISLVPLNSLHGPLHTAPPIPACPHGASSTWCRSHTRNSRVLFALFAPLGPDGRRSRHTDIDLTSFQYSTYPSRNTSQPHPPPARHAAAPFALLVKSTNPACQTAPFCKHLPGRATSSTSSTSLASLASLISHSVLFAPFGLQARSQFSSNFSHYRPLPGHLHTNSQKQRTTDQGQRTNPPHYPSPSPSPKTPVNAQSSDFRVRETVPFRVKTGVPDRWATFRTT